MPSASQTAATVDDLHRAEGKAELIGGRIIHLMPTGFRPGQIGGRIYRSLDDHAVATGHGVALPDNVGFVVPELSSERRSFSPDVSFFWGPLPSDGMDFIAGPPTFAVEVRSKRGYGSAAEIEMAAKRRDYFEAGTVAVWDVDPKAEVVRLYQAETPDQPTVFNRHQTADAESAVPGWRLAIDRIFA